MVGEKLDQMTPKMIEESQRRIGLLQAGFEGAPAKFQPVIPRGIPREVPFTEGQMITWENLRDGTLPVSAQLDSEAFIRLGCRWSCTNCSVPKHIRHAPEVLMRPEAWGRVFEIIENQVVARANPNLASGDEPLLAPYERIIGGEPSTYSPMETHKDQAVDYGDVVDVMRMAKEQPYFMAGLFSDGASLYQQPEKMEELVDVLERFHTSVDYLPKDELPDLAGPASDREKRGSYGGHVAAFYASRGIDSVANIVLIPPDPEKGEIGNLNAILEISRWLWQRGVTTTYVPIIWREHRAQHGRKEQAYATELRQDHVPLLKDIAAELVRAQLSGEGKIRNSRAYLEGIALAGVDQLIGWSDIPGTVSISPDLRMGYDPVFKTLAEVFDSPGGYYGYEDHQGKWEGMRWGDDYFNMLQNELQKWQAIVDSGRTVATRVDPLALVETIKQALDYWTVNHTLLEPSLSGKGEWWGNTIKNTKVGKYKRIYRKDL